MAIKGDLIGAVVGEIRQFSRTTAPVGWLACPVSQTNISRTTYAALFAAIGTTWGAGDGATTFGMPWFAADYSPVQSNSNVGSAHVGTVISHNHTEASAIGTPSGGNVGVGAGKVDSQAFGAISTGTTGSAANTAAGVRLLFCVKY